MFALCQFDKVIPEKNTWHSGFLEEVLFEGPERMSRNIVQGWERRSWAKRVCIKRCRVMEVHGVCRWHAGTVSLEHRREGR